MLHGPVHVGVSMRHRVVLTATWLLAGAVVAACSSSYQTGAADAGLDQHAGSSSGSGSGGGSGGGSGSSSGGDTCSWTANPTCPPPPQAPTGPCVPGSDATGADGGLNTACNTCLTSTCGTSWGTRSRDPWLIAASHFVGPFFAS